MKFVVYTTGTLAKSKVMRVSTLLNMLFKPESIEVIDKPTASKLSKMLKDGMFAVEVSASKTYSSQKEGVYQFDMSLDWIKQLNRLVGFVGTAPSDRVIQAASNWYNSN